jgi:hypothetical protein
MSSKVDSGRIETILAAVVLVAVIALFVRFQLREAPPPAPELPTAAEVSTPVAPDATPQN